MEHKDDKTFKEKVIKFANESPTNGILVYGILKIIIVFVFILIAGGLICGICNLFN